MSLIREKLRKGSGDWKKKQKKPKTVKQFKVRK